MDNSCQEDNILIPSLDKISDHIAEFYNINIKEDNGAISYSTSPTNSKEFRSGKKESPENSDDIFVSMLGELDFENNEDCNLDIQTLCSSDQKSPISSPLISKISQHSNSSIYSFEEHKNITEDSESDNNYKETKSHNKTTSIFDIFNDVQNFRKQIIGSIDPKYIKKKLVYLCRIYTGQESVYKYIIGFTHNMEHALESIDDIYTCEWKMEILTLIEANSQNMEIKIKYDILQLGVDIESGLYEIDWRVHKHMLELGGYINPFYMIDNHNNETYLGKKITHIDHTSEHIE